MSSIDRVLSRTAAAGIITAGMLGGIAVAPAQATIQDCTTYNFVSIPYNKSGSQKDAVDLGGGRRVQLLVSTVSGASGDHGFAKISGSTKRGDLVWMDWSTTSGNGHIQCGPFTVQGDGLPNTSAAKKVNYNDSRYVFRACGRIVGGETKCTSPWW
ncbi:hypothetical protein [Nonomuraea fuscirosea]|uniref:hypothetical protein n=1 Tax=Nonomuraea fuscirosea TaxID=1291556 RepID=UPI00340E251D